MERKWFFKVLREHNFYMMIGNWGELYEIKKFFNLSGS